jgi:hypothetical protein
VDLQCTLSRQRCTCRRGRETYLGLGVDQVGEEGKLDGPVLSWSRQRMEKESGCRLTDPLLENTRDEGLSELDKTKNDKVRKE